jgi:hypothetical protein
VATYQEAWQLMEKISHASLERFLRGKEKVLIGNKRRNRP